MEFNIMKTGKNKKYWKLFMYLNKKPHMRGFAVLVINMRNELANASMYVHVMTYSQFTQYDI